MIKERDIFKLAAVGLFAYDGDIHMEDLYQAIKARLIRELQVSSEELLYPAALEARE